MTSKRFKDLGPNKWLPVVSPVDGEILHVRYAINFGGGIIEIRGDKPRISDHHADQGYRLLSEVYAEDADPEIKADGFGHYMKYQKAIDDRVAPREELDGNGRSTFQRFPVDWLPSAVRSMQSGEQLQKWAPPSRAKAKAAPKAKVSNRVAPA